MSTNQLKPYFIISSVTLFSDLPIEELLEPIEKALTIPKFELDRSGDYEDGIVYLSHCLGFQILFCKDEGTSNQYQLAVDTARDTFDFSEVVASNLSWDDSLLALLQNANTNLVIRERRPEDDPDI